MAVTNPPGFLQNAGDTHTAAQLRTYLAGLQAGTYSTAATIRARGGVHPSLGQQLVVTQTGSPSMGVIVDTGVASIPGTESGTQGNYLVTNDAQVTLSIAASSPTLPRIDIVVFNVRDAFYSGASNDSQLQVIIGTPASSPVAPAAPVNSIILAEVAVAANATSITNANITDTRFYLAGVGGVINARNEASRPASAEINVGQHVWTMDNNKLWIWDGAAYNQTYPVLTLPIDSQIQNVAGTTTSTTYTATLSVGTACGLAFTAPASGKVLITHNCEVSNSASGFSLATIRVGTGASIGAGTVVIAAADEEAVFASGLSVRASTSRLVTGLTAGSPYNVQEQFRVTAGTGTFQRKSLIVESKY